MFAKPRPKKSLLPPPNKKRRATSSVEEVAFDNDARQEYLTGFHKRKQQRIKHAQEQAAKRAREEKIEARKQMRAERRREVEEHVETVNKLLRESGAAGDDIAQDSQEDESDEWDGIADKPALEVIGHEEEYIDEDRFTTVTVETVSVSRDGLAKPEIYVEKEEEDDEGGEGKSEDPEVTQPSSQNPSHDTGPKRVKKKKFRYESKLERRLTERKQKAKGRSRRPG